MNNFERIAVFTIIDNIEGQLRGLKTLLAASANPGVGSSTHKVHGTPENHLEMSDDEEKILQQELTEAREKETKRMAAEAEKHFGKQWQDLHAEMHEPIMRSQPLDLIGHNG